MNANVAAIRADACKVNDSQVLTPCVPGTGFEAKNALYQVMMGLVN
jgi:hypothetical protein